MQNDRDNNDNSYGDELPFSQALYNPPSLKTAQLRHAINYRNLPLVKKLVSQGVYIREDFISIAPRVGTLDYAINQIEEIWQVAKLVDLLCDVKPYNDVYTVQAITNYKPIPPAFYDKLNNNSTLQSVFIKRLMSHTRSEVAIKRKKLGAFINEIKYRLGSQSPKPLSSELINKVFNPGKTGAFDLMQRDYHRFTHVVHNIIIKGEDRGPTVVDCSSYHAIGNTERCSEKILWFMMSAENIDHDIARGKIICGDKINLSVPIKTYLNLADDCTMLKDCTPHRLIAAIIKCARKAIHGNFFLFASVAKCIFTLSLGNAELPPEIISQITKYLNPLDNIKAANAIAAADTHAK